MAKVWYSRLSHTFDSICHIVQLISCHNPCLRIRFIQFDMIDLDESERNQVKREHRYEEEYRAQDLHKRVFHVLVATIKSNF